MASCAEWQNNNERKESEMRRRVVKSLVPGIKSTYLDELDVRKSSVVSISRRTEELKLFNVVRSLKISNPFLQAVSSNASPTIRTYKYLDFIRTFFMKKFLGFFGNRGKRKTPFTKTVASPQHDCSITL
jgi:hypothetical protein